VLRAVLLPEPAQPKYLCSLTELSQTLDRSAANAPFADLGATPLRVPGRRRRGPERWQMGVAVFGAMWVLFCGVLVMAASKKTQSFSTSVGMVPDTVAVEPEIVQLEDPVQQGRGGRAPDVLNPLAEAPDGKCLGTRIAFVDGLAAATRQARERNKLLMILNVSGDFDDARFT
jgi:hypothetical protein